MILPQSPKYKDGASQFPAHLKDPRNFKPIQKALFAVLQSTHSHAEVIDWYKCFPCMQRVKDHKDMMKKLGFRTPAMYLQWKRIHEEIRNRGRVPLAKYNS